MCSCWRSGDFWLDGGGGRRNIWRAYFNDVDNDDDGTSEYVGYDEEAPSAQTDDVARAFLRPYYEFVVCRRRQDDDPTLVTVHWRAPRRYRRRVFPWPLDSVIAFFDRHRQRVLRARVEWIGCDDSIGLTTI